MRSGKADVMEPGKGVGRERDKASLRNGVWSGRGPSSGRTPSPVAAARRPFSASAFSVALQRFQVSGQLSWLTSLDGLLIIPLITFTAVWVCESD